jgi:hypothetical protein
MGTAYWRKNEWFGAGARVDLEPRAEYFHIGMVVLHFLCGRPLGLGLDDTTHASHFGGEFKRYKSQYDKVYSPDKMHWGQFWTTLSAAQCISHDELRRFQHQLSTRLEGCDGLIEAHNGDRSNQREGNFSAT